MRGRVAVLASVLAAASLATTRASADERDATPPPAYVDIDFTVLNVGVSFAGHLGRGVYLGLGMSLAPALTLNTFRAYPLEEVDAHAFVRYEPVPWLDLDGGARVSYFEEYKLCIFNPCGTPPSGALTGPYFAVAVGPRHFKIGPRVEYAVRSDTGESGVLFYPAMLRVALTPAFGE